MHPAARSSVCAVLLLAASAGPSMGQDVLEIGREHGTPVPQWIREALARDPRAFEVRNGWRPALARAKAQRAALALRGIDASALPPAAAAAYGTAVTGTFAVPVLAIMYANTNTEPYPAAQLQATLFGTGTGAITLSTFYTENSRGSVTVTGTVSGWARAAYKDTYYEGNDNGTAPYLGELLREAVEQLDAAIDFSQYDSDGDGIVDAVAFVHPEAGGECGNANIWSHRWTYQAASGGRRLFTKDGVEVVDYSIQPAFDCDGVTPIQIGVFAHETGHLWGLPDLYAINQSNAGIGVWGLMASGNWNRPASPAHMSAWSKAELGWLPVKTIAADTNAVALAAAETAGDAIRIDIPTSPGEYFLLENRQRLGSDAYLKGTGLLVWHVDSVVIANNLFSNSVQNDVARKGLDLVEADDSRALDTPGGVASSAQTFPGSTYNYTFNGVTNPSSLSNAGLASGIGLQNIVESAGVITFDVRFEQPGCAPSALTVGATQSGALAATDCADDGHYYDAWVLNLDVTTTLRMDVSSAAFDAYILLTGAAGNEIEADDNDAGGTNARIERTLPAGQYVLWVTSLASGYTGDYTIATTQTSVTGCSSSTVTLGQTMNGSLTSADCTVDGRFFDQWRLSLSAETKVRFELSSTTFDAYLILADSLGTTITTDDDGAGDRNSRIERTLPPGNYIVGATSFAAGEKGFYTLRAFDSGTATCTPGALAIGDSKNASLEITDCQAEGHFFDAWTLQVAADTVLRLDLSSLVLDTYLILTDTAGDTLAVNDDRGTGTNSRVELNVAAGQYVVWATSFKTGATGRYTLSASVVPACSSSSIVLGQTLNGALSSTDCERDGRYHDAWVFDVPADTTVRIELTSGAFDTYVSLEDASGNLLLENDDNNSSSNALLEAALAAGRFVVWATSYAAETEGAYTLAVTAPVAGECSTSAIAVGQTVTGSLASTDCANAGHYVDDWELVLSAETALEVDLTSSAFDAFLVIMDSTGAEVASNDNRDGGTTDSQIQDTLLAGRYTVRVTSYAPGATGAYVLTAAAASSGACTAYALTVGQSVTGALTTSDCVNPQGYYLDPWYLNLASETGLKVDLTSSEFDVYLILTDVQSNPLAYSDDVDGGTNARIDTTLAAGEYYVWATSAYPGITGSYTLLAAAAGSESAACYRRGDANADGVIDRADAGLLLEWLARSEELDAPRIARADVNGDGAVDLKDAQMLAKLVAGTKTTSAGAGACVSGVVNHE